MSLSDLIYSTSQLPQANRNSFGGSVQEDEDDEEDEDQEFFRPRQKTAESTAKEPNSDTSQALDEIDSVKVSTRLQQSPIELDDEVTVIPTFPRLLTKPPPPISSSVK